MVHVSVASPLYGQLSVDISGPTLIQNAGTYTWQANPTGGDGSYSYQWSVHYYINNTDEQLGTDQTQDLYVDQFCNFQMQVDVTSAGMEASNTFYVQNEVGGSCGPEKPVAKSIRRRP